MTELNTDFPLHLFHHGENFNAYRFMGAHPVVVNRKRGYVFRVWAPHAVKVSVVGDFNGWAASSHVMNRMIDNETFELFIPGIKQFDVYKYCIETRDGREPFIHGGRKWFAAAAGAGKKSVVSGRRDKKGRSVWNKWN